MPQVREHVLQLVTEACRQADWDGVELDWQRHAFHLPADDAYRLRYTLTDLMRAIRAATEAIAVERGRPFYVSARVATTFESCRRIGYDVETWVRDGLCDIVISGGNSGTDPGAEVERTCATYEDTNRTVEQSMRGPSSGVRRSCFGVPTASRWSSGVTASIWRPSTGTATVSTSWSRAPTRGASGTGSRNTLGSPRVAIHPRPLSAKKICSDCGEDAPFPGRSPLETHRTRSSVNLTMPPQSLFIHTNLQRGSAVSCFR